MVGIDGTLITKARGGTFVVGAPSTPTTESRWEPALTGLRPGAAREVPIYDVVVVVVVVVVPALEPLPTGGPPGDARGPR